MDLLLDTAINAIYEAGADDQKWDGVLGQLMRHMDGLGAVLHVGDTDCSGFAFGANHNVDPEALDAYAQHFYAINPLNPPLTCQPAGVVVSDTMLLPRREYANSEFFNDYAKRFNLAGSATAVLAKSDGQIACLGVVQRYGSDPYEPADLVLLQRLLPHLQRAIDLNRKLAACRAERDHAQAALDAMELAVIFIAEDGTLLRANRSGESLLRDDGLTIRRGRVTARDIAANARLQAAIDAALNLRDGRGDTLAIPRSGGRRPMLARVLPYLREAEPIEAACRAIMFIRDPDLCSPGTVAQAASLYGLTRRETNLVEALLDVSDVKAAAEHLEITEVTARNHLARVMAKTGTSKQGELVKVILSTRLPVG